MEKSDIKTIRAHFLSDKIRSGIISEIVSAAAAIDNQVEMILSVTLATNLGAASALPKGQPRPDPKQIATQTESARGPLKKTQGPLVQLTMSVVYNALTNDELVAYRNYLLSPIGQKDARRVNAAFKSALTGRALAIGAEFTKAVTAVDL